MRLERGILMSKLWHKLYGHRKLLIIPIEFDIQIKYIK